MKKAFVIGSPIDHSLSPEIFSFLSHYFHQDLEYQKQHVDLQSIGSFKKQLLREATVGCNITYPLKEAILEGESFKSESVHFLEAANVMHMQNGRAYYHNTDWRGFTKSLPQKISSVALFGFGSTTRSVLYSLCKQQCPHVFIKVRSTKTETLDWVDKFRKNFPMSRIALVPTTPDVDLVVNTLPRSTIPADDFFDFEDRESLLVYDVNYGDSAFLSRYPKAHKQNGLSMLIYQALETWGLWFEPLSQSVQQQLHAQLIQKLEGHT